ncbi:hypothetical protein GGU11DRAFT_861162 [Lentinula aff. detonsa]|uniref:Uncharacterized protein n=1 Tax=Lentinula aff. detonsa TaxID=2804958 RepID=A0AA38NTA9_9AGAR|nr:hypothetical protein GGU10DRAFT_129166 [Lentinula aff. detonsa]KAJ3799177.1 hypothetical protein GGU11DRAFT_861162 [Lentinula aff. detonsa]
MRKISYVITFLAVVVSLIFNVLSLKRVDWLVVKTPEVLHTQITVRYGLTTLCELKHVNIPGSDNNSRLEYTSYDCRPFPKRVQDGCEEENSGFCAAWTSAGYAVEISIGFAVLALFAILIGVSTGSRRRRIWKAVAGLVALHAVMQIVAFAIVTDTMRTGAFPTFEDAKPGTGYIFNTFAWIFSVLVAAGVVLTGVSADKGHKWAAGNRAYRRIDN